RCLEADSKIQTQIDYLQEQIRKLRLRGGKLQRSMAKSQPTTMAALESFAKLDCHQFCDTVYRAFPREIRDIIYGFIHPGEELSVIEPPPGEEDEWGCYQLRTYFDFTSEPDWRAVTRKNVEKSDMSYLHMWDAECMGDKVFQELVEYYFRFMHFNFGAELCLIPQFQINDQWSIGKTPSDFVTNIEVSVDFRGFNVGVDNQDDERQVCRNRRGTWGHDHCDGHNYKLPQNTRRTQLLAHLQALFGFKAGTKIYIHVGGHEPSDPVLEELVYARETAIPIIFPTLQRLSKSGMVVKVVLTDAAPTFGACASDFVVDGAIPTLKAWEDEIKKVSRLAKHVKCKY
ncbi:hypothetical protein FB567DRAFT_611128, partial [Paraphoma chrysanthemicola]